MKNIIHLTMNDCATDDKPREKMERNGKKTLSNAELLAILLRSGSAERNVLELAQVLLKDNGNSLTILSQKSILELKKTKGIGLAKATSIAAALELGIRLASENQRPDKNVIKNSTDLYSVIAEKLSGRATESFWAIYLNNSHRLLDTQCISIGGITQTAVDIRLIFKRAVELSATAIAVAHNHPSGNLKPSIADNQLTQKIYDAGKILDIKLIDHIIIGNGGLHTNDYYSYSDNGRL